MGRVLGRSEAAATAAALRRHGRKIVFTNGCFDILHAGHVAMLQAARELGDVLFVGLNADASVKRLKGPDRPIFPERDRAEVLGALCAVDYVVVFEEDTPYALIAQILPHVLAKGGDWAEDAIVGRDLVLAAGGQVVRIPYREGSSSTAVLERIRSSGGKPTDREA